MPMPAPFPLDQCPYRGLLPYREEDSKYFFGRENWCTIIPNNLLASPLTLLYGPSGVGKSSVLLAGVASRLKQQAKESVANATLPIKLLIVCREWQDDPLAKVRAQIQREFEDLMGRPLASLIKLLPLRAIKSKNMSLGTVTPCLTVAPGFCCL